MKKILSFWPMAMMLLFGALCFTACGDDDDDNSSKNDQTEKDQDEVSGKTQNSIPWGYYAPVYEDGGNTYYGNLDYFVSLYMKDVIAADDQDRFTKGIFQQEGTWIGLYVYIKNGVTYGFSLWGNPSKAASSVNTEYNTTYDSKTFTDQHGKKVTVYYNITSIDPDACGRLDLNDIKYDNGYLTIKDSDIKYKRMSFETHIPWLDEWCSDLVEKLQSK